jgi:hypothetical protein
MDSAASAEKRNLHLFRYPCRWQGEIPHSIIEYLR